MNAAAKPYKTRGMVEVARTRANFDTILRSEGEALLRSKCALVESSKKGLPPCSGVGRSKLKI